MEEDDEIDREKQASAARLVEVMMLGRYRCVDTRLTNLPFRLITGWFSG